MKMIIQMFGLVTGERTGFYGKYIVDYDPSQFGSDPITGEQIIANIVCTSNPNEAKKFNSLSDAVEFVRQEHGLRNDGLPNRPLTAFNLNFQSQEETK